MSDKPSGDNKIHQVVMALITTIAAPVIVFFITNNIRNSTPPAAPTVPVQVVTATFPPQGAATAAQPTPTGNPAAQPTAQPTLPGINNPSGTIPAGVPALVDGLSLTVSAQDVTSDGRYIHVKVHVKNPSKGQRALVFTPGAVTLKDDTGHSYDVVYGDKKSGCKRQDLSVSHNLAIDSQGTVTLASAAADKAGAWCAENPGGAIPLFAGPIARGAKKLEVQINGVGPFKGFQIEVGL